LIDWTHGYVADIGYTFGYYAELNPLRTRLAFLQSGISPPAHQTACELGFGQGLSANLHAASSTAAWFGTDFNPSQASFAAELAQVAGSGARLFDEAFSEFCQRPDLPDFDFIGLHGIWSWISDENRAVIVDFLRRKLKLGGVLYISYNTQPGWTAMLPVRDLLTEHAEVMGARGRGIVNRVDDALQFADEMMALNPKFSAANPQVADRLKKIKDQNRHYLAHEYFNRDWQPMSFSRMKEWLSAAKLQFACSAHFQDHLEAINITPEQQKFLAAIPDPMFRQTVLDFFTNQQFRRDYWVKGVRQLSAIERTEQLREVRVVLVQARADVALKVTGQLGEATLQENVYGPILDLLADHEPRTLGEIEGGLAGKGVNLAQVTQAAVVLSGMNAIAAAQDADVVSRVKERTLTLNRHLMMKARSGNDISFLASPVTGGGVQVARFHQLFLLALSAGKSEPQQWAQAVWEVLAAQGQRLVKDGKAIESAEENLAELNRQAREFAEKQLGVLRKLQVV